MSFTLDKIIIKSKVGARARTQNSGVKLVAEWDYRTLADFPVPISAIGVSRD
jgi:hypothetical protein